MDQERLWTKDFITVSVINFLVFLIHLLLMVIIASYAIDRFHASTSVAGLVASIFIVGALIGRLGTGRFIEDIGSKRVLIGGAVFFILTVALYFTAINLQIVDHRQIIARNCSWRHQHGDGNHRRPDYSR